jgi:hypothetical protein
VPVSKLSKKRLKSERERAQAYNLREAGLTFQQIAVEMKISKKWAWQLCSKAFDQQIKENAETAERLRVLRVRQLTRMLPAAYTIIEQTAKDDDGHIVPVHSAMERVAAMDKVVKTIHEIAWLEGSAMPTKTTLTNLPDLGTGVKEPTPADAARVFRELFKENAEPGAIPGAAPPMPQSPPSVATPDEEPPKGSDETK